jgi:hypothetical protein
MASGLLGEQEWSACGSPQNNARVLQAGDRQLVLALFNAHGATRPALLTSWLAMLGRFVPGSWAWEA